jgi:hypothetical protein
MSKRVETYSVKIHDASMFTNRSEKKKEKWKREGLVGGKERGRRERLLLHSK